MDMDQGNCRWPCVLKGPTPGQATVQGMTVGLWGMVSAEQALVSVSISVSLSLCLHLSSLYLCLHAHLCCLPI